MPADSKEKRITFTITDFLDSFAKGRFYTVKYVEGSGSGEIGEEETENILHLPDTVVEKAIE